MALLYGGQPHQELRANLNKKVHVLVNDGREVFGILVAFDPFMNLSLRNVQVLSPKMEKFEVESCIVRGSTILSFEGVNIVVV